MEHRSDALFEHIDSEQSSDSSRDDGAADDEYMSEIDKREGNLEHSQSEENVKHDYDARRKALHDMEKYEKDRDEGPHRKMAARSTYSMIITTA